MKAICKMCQEKPARVLKASQPYTFATKEPVFCSRKCAADYGLVTAFFEDQAEFEQQILEGEMK